MYITGSMAAVDSGYCAAWDSIIAARGYMDCTPDGSTCTTISVKKGHIMSPSAGVFMMKRIKCTPSACKVSKLGQCFDVSPAKPFKNCKYSSGGECIYTTGDAYDASWLEKYTAAFAKLVLDQMRAGTTKECRNTTLRYQHQSDYSLGQSLIKSS